MAFNHESPPYATWVVDAKGTAVRKIVDADPGERSRLGRGQYGHYADVSPDGSRIVYSTCEYTYFDHDKRRMRYNRGYEIAAVNVDGSGQQRLTDNVHFENYPVWSPDGNRIAFIAHSDDSRWAYYFQQPSHYETSNSDIFTRSADGTDERVVPNTKGVGLYPPVWSPDGQRLAFTAHEVSPPSTGRSEPQKRILYTVRLNGLELSRIGEATTLPTWSPDGEGLAFGLDDRVYSVRFDGTDRTEVLDDFRASEVSWSPDGRQLLLASDGGVYVVRPDGSDLLALAPNPEGHRVTTVAWSADGSMIAARRELPDAHSGARQFEIFVMARDGTDMRVLARAEARQLYASNPPPPSIDPAACLAGVVVTRGQGANPDLVEDCEALARTWNALASHAVDAPSGISGWDTGTPMAEWPGVEVAGDPPRVRKLILKNSGLTGPIPVDIAMLTMLEMLDLSYNQLTGPIPPELAGLSMLRKLYLVDNALSGAIPPELGKLAALEELYLSYNDLSGTLPPELIGMRDLRTASLKENDLSGCIPLELPDLWVEASGLKRCEP